MKVQVNVQVRKKYRPNPKELVMKLDRLVERVVERIDRKLRKKDIRILYSGLLLDIEYDVEHRKSITIYGVKDPEKLKKIRDMIMDAIIDEIMKRINNRYFEEDEWDFVDVVDHGFVYEYPLRRVWFGLSTHDLYDTIPENEIEVSFMIERKDRRW